MFQSNRELTAMVTKVFAAIFVVLILVTMETGSIPLNKEKGKFVILEF